MKYLISILWKTFSLYARLFTPNPELRVEIIRELSRTDKRRERYEKKPVFLTSGGIAITLDKEQEFVDEEIRLMLFGGLIYPPLHWDERFIGLTPDGLRLVPMRISK